MAFALPLEPTPTSIETLAERLPAATRARIAWFPAELRAAVIEPLRRATRAKLPHAIEQAAVAAFGIFVRLADVTAVLFEDEALASVLITPDVLADERLRSAIARRLAARDPIAAGELLEAHEWLRAILSGMIGQMRTEIAMASRALAAMPALSEEDVRAELRGPSGSLLRGMVLTIAAIDVLLSDAPLPGTLSRWCDLAASELQAAANSFRAAGLMVPTAVGGRDASGARARSRLLPSLLPPGVDERIVETFAPEAIWLFGSRARGTHGPASDWDVLAVLADGTAMTPRMSQTLADLRRERVELFLASRSEFDQGKDAAGSLAHIATTEGIRIRG